MSSVPPVAQAAEHAERAHARLGRDRQAGGLLEAQRVRLGREVLQHRVLGRRAAHGEAEHRVSDLRLGALADLVDDAGRLAAVDHREAGVAAQHAAAQLVVDRVHARRADRDADLAGAGMRLRDVGEVQDVRTAEFRVDHCVHGQQSTER